jgi:hypothetical protein
MMKMNRKTFELASASVLLAFALGFSTTGAVADEPTPDTAKAPETAPAKAPAPAPSAEVMTMLLGDWKGTLDTGEGAAKLRLALHLAKNPDGTLGGTLDSLDEKVKGIPVDNVSFADGTLGLNMPTIGAHCEATLAPNGVELKGTWYKAEATFPLVLKKGAAPAAGH